MCIDISPTLLAENSGGSAKFHNGPKGLFLPILAKQPNWRYDF